MINFPFGTNGKVNILGIPILLLITVCILLQAWVGHPYYDVIDNSTDFEAKVTKMINVSFCLKLVLRDIVSFSIKSIYV